ncbi:MAG TPA: tetratricopeptide repeat protein [Candidatus Acidoferrales bacterium]|nr:tetratricopeptide repeat protein [Candidatus Acidoferrales bacterium]
MIRSAKALLLLVPLGSLVLAQTPAPTPNPAETKADAYYHFAMGRVYAELAQAYGNRPEYLNKALQHYQEALKLDPSAGVVFEELTDLYIQTNRLRDAVSQAEDVLKQNPDNIDARRMLGRIYMRMISTADNRINEEYLKKAIEQLQKVTEKDPKDADSWVLLGRLFGAANNSVESEKAYNKALEADPESEDALTGLATLYAALGDSKRAAEKLKAAADKSPSERTLIALGQAYEDLHDYKNAAEALGRALELQPENTKLAFGVAENLMRSGQLDKALELFQKLAADDPRNVPARLSIAEIYRVKRDFPNAQEALAKVKALDADSLEVRYEEVRLLEAQNKYSEAIAALNSLLTETAKKTYSANESASRARLLDELGTLQRGAGKYTEAVDTYRKALAMSKEDSVHFYLNIVDTYRAAKDMEAARREIDAAAAEIRKSAGSKADFQTYSDLAALYEKGKRWSDMAKVLDEAAKVAGTDEQKEQVMFTRGAMLERQKKIDAAEAEFRKVIGMNPNHAGALNYLGYMLVDHGLKVDEATKLIQKALEIDPDNGAYLDSLGWAFYQQGKFSEAEVLLVRALDRIGQDPTVHDHLADVYLKLGRTKDAISQWQASLKDFQSPAGADSEPDDIAKVTRKLDAARVQLAKENK